MLNDHERRMARDCALRYPQGHGFHWFSEIKYSIIFTQREEIEDKSHIKCGDPAITVAAHRVGSGQLTRKAAFQASCDIADDLGMKMIPYLMLLDADPAMVAAKLDQRIGIVVASAAQVTEKKKKSKEATFATDPSCGIPR